jgi:multimeric flavodoxin WrbA
MKVVAFNGSPNEKGSTFNLLQIALKEIKSEGIETELVQLAKMKIQPCKACFRCKKEKNLKCNGIVDDGLNEAVEKMLAADGILIGSPTWFANVSGHVKNLIDRAGLVMRANDMALNRKVGAAVVAARRAGAVPAFDAINRFFQINGVVVPGSLYWNLGLGYDEADKEGEDEGTRTMISLGSNMAWLMKKLFAN